MPNSKDLIRLRHMLDAAIKVKQFAKGRSRVHLDTDEMFGLAVVRLLEIIGEVVVELYAATDGRDTDFTVKLIDVYSDGRAIRLGSPKSGIIRARFRNGLEKQELLTPGKIEKYSISGKGRPSGRPFSSPGCPVSVLPRQYDSVLIGCTKLVGGERE